MVAAMKKIGLRKKTRKIVIEEAIQKGLNVKSLKNRIVLFFMINKIVKHAKRSVKPWPKMKESVLLEICEAKLGRKKMSNESLDDYRNEALNLI